MLVTMIVNLLNAIRIAITVLIQFLAILFLAILAAILIALPWLLRAASMLIWLAAAFVGIQTIETIYSPTTEFIPLFALKFAVIYLMVAWVVFALKERIQLWGTLVANGLIVSSFSYGALWIADHWQYANLFFAILPTLIFAVGTFSLAIRLRMKRNPEVDMRHSETVEAIPA
jgi:hypothetical protein